MLTPSDASLEIRRDLVALLPRLRRFALTLTAAVEEADALVRAACGWAIANARLRDEDLGLDAWVFGAARHLAGENARRRERRSGSAPAAGTMAATTNDTREQSLVTSMTPGLASAFLLVEVEKFTYAEAADILDVSVGTLAGNLCRARLHFASQAHVSAELRA